MLRYADWGLDFLGNVVFVTPGWAEKNSQAMSAFVACAADGITIADDNPSGMPRFVRMTSCLPTNWFAVRGSARWLQRRTWQRLTTPSSRTRSTRPSSQTSTRRADIA
jgi:hypothetical protein